MSRAGPWLIAIILSFGLTGCAGLPGSERSSERPEVQIGGLVIFNRGQGYVTAARVIVPATGQFVSCGNIGPGARCATGFPERLFTGNPVEVTWSQGGSIYSTGELGLDLPQDAIASGRAIVRVWIMGPGSAAAEVVDAGEP
jgi:hypothetical protein